MCSHRHHPERIQHGHVTMGNSGPGCQSVSRHQTGLPDLQPEATAPTAWVSPSGQRGGEHRKRIPPGDCTGV